jgi:hypothetical protein
MPETRFQRDPASATACVERNLSSPIILLLFPPSSPPTQLSAAAPDVDCPPVAIVPLLVSRDTLIHTRSEVVLALYSSFGFGVRN